MFVDHAKVYVKGGDGGDGMVAFRREIFIPDGGPAGGDGGRGGDVIFVVDEGLRTLMDFRYQRHFKAKKGENGRSKSQIGADAEHLYVRIPPGTTITDEDTQQVIADMTRHGQEVVVAQGGRGGRGNIRFATPNNPAPEIAENGEEGVERSIVLELKVMADVGLVGFPSVGKSTLLSVVSQAKPKIADYHFTTLKPNLGVVRVDEERNFVLADLPGLIEGAHEGVGLGHEFLRHIERTRVLVHVIDMSGMEGRDPFEDFLLINDELKKYNPLLADRPQIIAANKMDMVDAEEHLSMFKEQLQELDWAKHMDVIPISALTRNGLQPLLFRIAEVLETVPDIPLIEEVSENEERKVFKFEEDGPLFTIKRENEGFMIESKAIERIIRQTRFGTYDATMRFARTLRNMGVDKELRKMGAKDGQIIRIGEIEFEFVEHE